MHLLCRHSNLTCPGLTEAWGLKSDGRGLTSALPMVVGIELRRQHIPQRVHPAMIHVFRRRLTAMGAPIDLTPGVSAQNGASIGMAMVPDDAGHVSDRTPRADQVLVLCSAKRAGKGRNVFSEGVQCRPALSRSRTGI